VQLVVLQAVQTQMQSAVLDAVQLVVTEYRAPAVQTAAVVTASVEAMQAFVALVTAHLAHLVAAQAVLVLPVCAF